MVRIAIAGGTGGLGRSIAESIASTQKHELIVLSRSASDPDLERLGAKIVSVSYSDPASLDHALAGVHTVISVLFARDSDEFITSHLALLDAAVRAGAKRFAPSEWNLTILHDTTYGLYKPKAVVAEAVRKSGLEYTFFENGVFMNYLGHGTPGAGYINNFSFAVDIGKCTAAIPGDGNNKIPFTLTKDVGDFVTASLDLDKWPEVSMMAGDLKAYNEILALAEDIRGELPCLWIQLHPIDFA